MTMTPLLEVEHLSTVFATRDGLVKAVDDVSFSIRAGETLAMVGESGCGKSVTALSLLRLIQSPGKITGGSVWLHRQHERVDLLQLDPPALRAVRGADIAMIFQEPMTALNPVMRIGEQIQESLEVHRVASGVGAQHRVVELLQQVGIPEPVQRARDYPHQLSGGMRQRAMIAMALACHPRVLIADEPTTALDVTIQAQILSLLSGLQKEMHMGLLLITHDLGVVATVADQVVVMYAGKIVEQAPVRELFHHPKHPYTEGLLKAVPTFAQRGTRAPLATIPGRVPDLAHLPPGCAFQDRCYKAQPQCSTPPNLEEKSPKHRARCFFAREY